MQAVRKALAEALKEVQSKSVDDLVEARFEKLLGYGKFKEVVPSR
jgi:acetyl-CoA carboxylase carboxyl transferase subunit alpha